MDQPAARAGLDGQVDADAAQLARLAGAAHVLAVGEALAQSPQQIAGAGDGVCLSRSSSLPVMRPTGRLAWRRPAARAPLAATVEPLQASSVWGGDGPAGPGAWPRPASGARRRATGCSTPRRECARPRRFPGRRSVLTHCRPFRRLSRVPFVRADSGRRAAPKAGCGWAGSRAQRAGGIFRHRPGDPQASMWMLLISSARRAAGLYGACPI